MTLIGSIGYSFTRSIREKALGQGVRVTGHESRLSNMLKEVIKAKDLQRRALQ